MKIAWAGHNDVWAYEGAFGYTSASVNLRDALARRDDVEITDAARVAVHFCHPFNYRPDLWPGRENVLYTMYEFAPPPTEFASAFSMSDAIIVPTEFCAKLFRRAAGRKPILVSPLGYDPSRYSFVERSWAYGGATGQKFRFLWVGAPQQRKGWDVVMAAWEPLSKIPWLELMVKTTSSTTEREKREFKAWNITFSERVYSRAEMQAMYASAHAFLFPSRGEGFGLTALEALATGLPVVTVKHGGQTDFLDEKTGACFVPFHQQQVDTEVFQPWGVKCEPQDLGRAILDVVENYPVYLKAARRGAARARQEFSWDAAAAKLVEALRSIDFDDDRADAPRYDLANEAPLGLRGLSWMGNKATWKPPSDLLGTIRETALDSFQPQPASETGIGETT